MGVHRATDGGEPLVNKNLSHTHLEGALQRHGRVDYLGAKRIDPLTTIPMSEVPLSYLFCDRCLKQLVPGRGEFFEVRIEAVADPTPPDLDADLSSDPDELRQRYEKLLAHLKHVSPAEARDQVYRRVLITLCNQCYGTWIEDPAGRTSE